MTDRVYIFDKISKEKILLGEIQDNFNMSFVIDGTKDSSKIVVHSFSLVNEVEPNTILWHENTKTWWVISHDKVERNYSENGFLYIHELSIDGAVELLNARDLTDCGFNANRYDINQFIARLFRLSNFEFPILFLPSTLTAIDLNRKVDYVKTYENYTLLSALRDFLGGYNCDIKLAFKFNTGNTAIESAYLDIVSKSGSNSEVVDADTYFNQVAEIKTMDKNSFGTIVVSNAENVISTLEKTYPLVGGVKIKSTEFEIDEKNAVLRLPSKVYKANWVKIHYELGVTVLGTVRWIDVTDNIRLEEIFTDLEAAFASYPNAEQMIQKLHEDKDYIRQKIIDAGTITLYEGNVIDPTYNNGVGRILKGDKVPYLPKVYRGLIDIPTETIELILCDKETRDMLPKPYCGIYWERGSNEIKGFDFFKDFSMSTGLQYTDLQEDSFVWTVETGGSPSSLGIGIYHSNNDAILFNFKKNSCVVNYIPMADLKIKMDNQRDKKDIQLYNQNGKLTDSNALSKLLNSYSKEISSDTITRYYTCYGTHIDSIKKVGQRFSINNVIYVVNNLSLDFCQNENGYYIECEYTMSKQFAVKSLMVNPNTNIRDYGIPQNFNVERKQVYRDYYEFDYTQDTNADNNPYCEETDLLYFGDFPKETCSYMGVIKCKYNQAIGSTGNKSDTWYYQLDTTKYELDKSLYIVITFNDNNIIGYGSQNVYSGFDITRVFTNWFDNVCTPISYVDDNGEVKEISIAFVDSEQISYIYDTYKTEEGYSSENKSLYNIMCFIPQDIYDAAEEVAKMQIDEPNYRKDALEVPVFEYACQIGDSENVLIGDKILHQNVNEDYVYIYSFQYRNAFVADPINVTPDHIPELSNGDIFCSHGCKLWLYGTTSFYYRLDIDCYGSRTYDPDTNTFTNGNVSELIANKDILVFKHTVSKSTGSVISSDLILIARNVPSANIVDSNSLRLYINHWRLK